MFSGVLEINTELCFCASFKAYVTAAYVLPPPCLPQKRENPKHKFLLTLFTLSSVYLLKNRHILPYFVDNSFFDIVVYITTTDIYNNSARNSENRIDNIIFFIHRKIVWCGIAAARAAAEPQNTQFFHPRLIIYRP